MIQIVSAYLLKQQGHVSDEVNPKSKIVTRSKFKQMLALYPTAFEYHTTFLPPPIAGGYLAEAYTDYMESTGDLNTKTQTFLVLPSGELNPSIGYWVKKETGNYRVMDSGYTFSDVPNYVLMEYATRCVIPCDKKVKDLVNRTEIVTSSGIIQWAASGKTESITSALTYGDTSCYRLPLDIFLPIFDSDEKGADYVDKATRYHNDPTQANYEDVCDTIDQALNPDV